MKPRTQLLFVLGLLIVVFGLTLYTFSAHNPEHLPVFPATLNRDCAPWDGSAFTVSIPVQESMLKISIYQSPDITRPVTFSFPDETMRDGMAFLLLPVGSPEQLTGKVFFQGVEPGIPVEGRFDFVTDTGQHFSGKFRAEWGNQIVYCG